MSDHPDSVAPSKRLPPRGSLVTDSEGSVRATHFDDIFFSKSDGLAESRSVFMQGGDIVNAWRNRDHFTIGELGFGTGLNFLATWHAWRDSARGDAHLHFVSVEGFPLTREDAGNALARWPELKPLADQLLQQWPHAVRGVQRLWFADDRVCLTLHIDDIGPALRAQDAVVDCWFLDGFAPSKNPAMWTPEVFSELARLSRPGTRVATYTIAGLVRRGLTAAGFLVERRPGFGAKRESLGAVYQGPTRQPPPLFPRPAPSVPKTALVIGAGIAGACAAHALMRRGVEVTILDDVVAGAQRASGNPAALVMPRLDRGDTAAARFYKAAHIAALRLYANYHGHGFDPCGVVERLLDHDDAARFSNLADDPPLPADMLQPLARHAIHHLGSGIVRPNVLIAALTSGAARVSGRVERVAPNKGQWTAYNGANEPIACAALVVIAAGPALGRFQQTRWLPLTGSKGQISWAMGQGHHMPIPQAGGPYALNLDGDLIFGATFDKVAFDAASGLPLPSGHAHNLDLLAELNAAAAEALSPQELKGRVSIRATTADRMPIAGPVPDAGAYVEQFAGLATGQPISAFGHPPTLEGLHILGGLGSRGFSTAPLCAEILVSTALGEPLPVDRLAWEAVQPARFLIRSLKRKHALVFND